MTMSDGRSSVDAEEGFASATWRFPQLASRHWRRE